MVTPPPRLIVVLALAALNVAVSPVPGTVAGAVDQLALVAQVASVVPTHESLVARAGVRLTSRLATASSRAAVEWVVRAESGVIRVFIRIKGCNLGSSLTFTSAFTYRP